MNNQAIIKRAQAHIEKLDTLKAEIDSIVLRMSSEYMGDEVFEVVLQLGKERYEQWFNTLISDRLAALGAEDLELAEAIKRNGIFLKVSE